MKKILSFALVAIMVLGLFAGCTPATTNDGDGEVTIKVAAIETAYGAEMWKKVCEAFTAQTGIKVELTTDKNLEDIIGPQIQGNNAPDVVHLATGRPAGLTEQLIKANGLHDLTNVLNMVVPGETKKVSDKIAGGFTDTSLTNPYSDGKTYMAPMFYSPCGLFYNAKLFAAKGWTVPTTWDEMWTLGEKAKAEGIALFTYPTAGYYDAFMYALMYSIGGAEFFDKATHYAEGIWDTEEAKTMFNILDKLAGYTHEKTPAQANNEDFTKNQLMVMQDEALFMPNGTWIVGEMAEAQKTLTNDFAWGMTALPAVKAGGAGYSYTWFEQAWIPAGAQNKAAAEQFVAFLYSDKAVEIFAKTEKADGNLSGAMQPVLGIADKLEGDNKLFYSIYDNGAKAAMGNFAAFNAIPDVDTSKVFFEPIDKLVAGSLTIEEYVANIKTASDLMRANLKG